MNSYNKQALDIIAKEQGFIRDNLEKVMRLVEILNYFHHSPLLSKSLVLKGGTAIISDAKTICGYRLGLYGRLRPSVDAVYP